MTGYLEYQAASAPNRSLQHYAALHRREVRRSRAKLGRDSLTGRLLPGALVRRSRIA